MAFSQDECACNEISHSRKELDSLVELVRHVKVFRALNFLGAIFPEPYCTQSGLNVLGLFSGTKMLRMISRSSYQWRSPHKHFGGIYPTWSDSDTKPTKPGIAAFSPQLKPSENSLSLS